MFYFRLHHASVSTILFHILALACVVSCICFLMVVFFLLRPLLLLSHLGYVSLGLDYFFFCKRKTASEMRISDWSSDVCSSDLGTPPAATCPTGVGSAPACVRWRCASGSCRSTASASSARAPTWPRPAWPSATPRRPSWRPTSSWRRTPASTCCASTVTWVGARPTTPPTEPGRSEEHTSELQ